MKNKEQLSLDFASSSNSIDNVINLDNYLKRKKEMNHSRIVKEMIQATSGLRRDIQKMRKA